MSNTSSMTAIEISKPGGPDMLVATRRPIPTPSATDVLIKVAAAGINRPDVLQRMGLYPAPSGASDLPGLEVAGTITALGSDVSGWNIGDEVCALLPGGGYAEYALADAGSCLPMPEGFSMNEAAALPETYFTVWTNLFEDGKLKEGERVLIHGGTSGIGTTTIALAQKFGAEVFATAGNDEKCASLTKLGVTQAFNYKQSGWHEKIIAAGGVDVVLDMAGGDFFALNLACLKPNGRHVSIAFLRGVIGEVNVMDIMRKHLTIIGSTLRVRSKAAKASIAQALKSQVWPLLGPDLRPVIDSIYPLEQASLAHERMESGQHLGKIVLSTSK